MKSPDFDPEDLVSLKEYFCCGDRVQFNVREFLKSALKPGVFGVGYGITEAGLIAKPYQDADTSSVKDNIAGILTENFMAKIIDVNTGKQLVLMRLGKFMLKLRKCFRYKYF